LDAHALAHLGGGGHGPSMREQLTAMRRPAVWAALLTTLLGYGGVFTSYVYIAPQYTEVTGFSSAWITPLLLLFGAGLFVGNNLGGRLADARLMPSLLGTVATLAAATTAMGQVERGANRVYGIEQDRPTVDKYRHGLILACSAGVLIALALTFLVAGTTLARALGLEDALGTVFNLLRWPIGIALAVAAFALLFQRAPKRHQPDVTWLAFGSGLAVVLWLIFTGLLALYLTASSSFGQTYGPLAGTIGVLLWAFLTSLALYLGIAFAAQLEAVRAGSPAPSTGERVNPAGARAKPAR
jgi:YihY family inner membrane protein